MTTMLSSAIKISGFVLLLCWTILLLLEVPGSTDAFSNNLNISACYFCDDEVDFSVRNLICCSCCSRCCGPDRI